MFSTI